jgi:hypothetical protein
MSELKFYFSTKDGEFTSVTSVVDESDTNYVSHAFVRCPIYDFTSHQLIGYKVSDDYVQQVSENKYIVRLNNTYLFYDKDGKTSGTISWQYVFENTKPEIYYPVGIPAKSRIITSTGIYENKNGTVRLYPKSNGTRNVTIKFTN